jgi:NYN domain/OST-HTH/LOTUS domain
MAGTGATGPAGPSTGDLVAVFIDLENLALGAVQDLPGEAEPIPYKALERLCRDYGNTSIRRAYADWSKPEFGRYQHSLAQNGITLIQVTRFGAQQKNAADILMAVDAMEVLITHPDVGTFLLVAGDGDYSPLVQRLREFGKWVVGVGTQASASSRLVAVCSEYKYWGTIVAAVNPAVRAEVGANFDISDARRLIVAAMEEAPDDSVTGSWLKSKMMALDPSFDERNYGASSFRVLLSRLPDLVQVKKDRSSSDMLVTLVAPRPGKADTDGGQPAPARRRRATAKQAAPQQAAPKQTEQAAPQQGAPKQTEQAAPQQAAPNQAKTDASAKQATAKRAASRRAAAKQPSAP